MVKGECEILEEMISFEKDSWEKIKTNLSINRNIYPIGSTKIIEFDRNNDGINEYYKLRLANTEACGDYTGSRTSCGVVIEFVTFIGTHKMNSTANGTAISGDGNVGGWYSSEMRSYLNTDPGSVFSKLPSDLQSVIIGTAPIVSSSGSVETSSDIVASGDFSGDKLFLLSGKEVGLDLSYDNKKLDDDTRILKYYIENPDNNSRKKYSTTTLIGEDSSAGWYWLRSAYSDNTSNFYGIVNVGIDSNDSADNSNGVVPAFRILD